MSHGIWKKSCPACVNKSSDLLKQSSTYQMKPWTKKYLNPYLLLTLTKAYKVDRKL